MPRDWPIRCGVKKSSDGQPCKLAAGWGTDHPGTGPCIYHDGSDAHGRGRHVPLLQLADPKLRPLVLELINNDAELFDLRFEIATLRTRFAALAKDGDPRVLAELSRAIATVVTRLRELEVGRHYYIHVNVLGLVLQAVGEVVAQYLPDEERRRSFHADLKHVLRAVLPATTTKGVAASALVQPIEEAGELEPV